MRNRLVRLLELSAVLAVLAVLVIAYLVGKFLMGPGRHIPLGLTEPHKKERPMEDETPHGLPSYAASLIRTLLGLAGGWLIGKGYFTAEQMPQVIGGAVAVITAAWGLYQKINAHKALKAAVAAPAGRAA